MAQNLIQAIHRQQVSSDPRNRFVKNLQKVAARWAKGQMGVSDYHLQNRKEGSILLADAVVTYYY